MQVKSLPTMSTWHLCKYSACITRVQRYVRRQWNALLSISVNRISSFSLCYSKIQLHVSIDVDISGVELRTKTNSWFKVLKLVTGNLDKNSLTWISFSIILDVLLLFTKRLYCKKKALGEKALKGFSHRLITFRNRVARNPLLAIKLIEHHRVSLLGCEDRITKAPWRLILGCWQITSS